MVTTQGKRIEVPEMSTIQWVNSTALPRLPCAKSSMHIGPLLAFI